MAVPTYEGLSPMQRDELLTKIRAMSNEDKVLAVQMIDDDILWDEIYRRYNERKQILSSAESAILGLNQ